MKVIFLEDVPNVARAGEAKVVADGYGRNYLLPRGLAVLANSSAANVVEAQLKKIARREAQTEVEMLELAKQLEGREIVLKAKSGATDKLYGSVTSADIAEALSNAVNVNIDKRKVELEEPIRQLGDYEIAIRLFKEIAPKVKLAVVGEEAKEEEKEEQEKKPKAKKAKVAKAEKGEAEVTEGEEKAKKPRAKKTKEVKAEEGKAEAEGAEKKEKTEEAE